MKALIAEFGFEGYGRFWVLCERVAESSNARVDISKKVNKLDLAAELGLDGNGLDKFLAFLADPEIDLINLEDGVITVDRISERFTEVTKDREDARDRKARKKEKPESSGEPCESSDGKGESSGELSKKENKRKESKVNESKEEESSASFSQSQKDAFELSELLLTTHRKEISDYLSGKDDEKTIRMWAADIEKLIRIDKKQPETIRRVVLWAKTPGCFWFPNIQSGKKLREKYETLYGQMTRQNKTASSGKPPERRTIPKGLEI